MKKGWLTVLILLFSLQLSAQTRKVTLFGQLAPKANWVQEKNYYLLHLIQEDKVVEQQLQADPCLARLTQQKLKDLRSSLEDCKEPACFTDRLKFRDDEIKEVSTALAQLCLPGSALERLVKTKLIPSYAYSLYKTIVPAEILVKAWEQDAAGINYTIAVYAEGKKPNYPLIDSISFNTRAKMYTTLLYDANETLISEQKNTRLFFETAMQAALLYLQLNERQDPANYEPMISTVNKAAVGRIGRLNWAQYPYSVILVPGAGPEEPETPLSAEGMLRCRLAVQAYRAGKAPFIMPSGGKVHPYKTKYCEAEEMKKYMISILHIPEQAIILEPHARHTTTNMRNGVRLMYRYGFPAAKPGLVITDRSQTNSILVMAARCEKELKYVPYKLGKQLSATEVEFFMVPEAMQINSYEPLDP
ncbi:YdcF family protein [Mucilaginibacter corticis]|uniref:YdcF family protein n=1 Tax=Mucilaginibacter corticis TaxID=2597670 RepID=A0A556M7R3_9SPHI|nr:YdcF family protein [Mucilaginibacter corticis]TSJ35924.1 YdcF family protein [Mucilaginibacter corticis]